MLDSETQTFQRAWLHGRPRYRDYLAHSADGQRLATHPHSAVLNQFTLVSRAVSTVDVAHTWRACMEPGVFSVVNVAFPKERLASRGPTKVGDNYFAQHFSQHMPQCRGSSLVASHHCTTERGLVRCLEKGILCCCSLDLQRPDAFRVEPGQS